MYVAPRSGVVRGAGAGFFCLHESPPKILDAHNGYLYKDPSTYGSKAT